MIASNPLLSHILTRPLAAAGLERRAEIIRLVSTLRGGDRPKNAHEEFADITVMPRSMFEPWLLFRKPLEGRVQDNLRKWKTGALRRISPSQPFGDVILFYLTHATQRSLAPHPSLKPQSFMRQIVRAVLPLGEDRLDPFAGAGSTGLPLRRWGYQSIGTEHDPHYFKIAIEAIPLLKELSPGGRANSREASLSPRDGASRSESRALPENSSESAQFALLPGTRR